MVREVNVNLLTDNIKEMCIEATHYLSPDMQAALKKATEEEISPLGKKVLDSLSENLKLAGDEMIPICQDTGMAVVFLEIGQDVHFVGGDVTDAVNEGVRRGYVDGFLRKSVVGDPIIRVNTKDNTPAILHTEIVPGDKVKITVAPKGFGSENKSRMFMLTPADGIEGVKEAILTAVKDAGPNACPPMVVGVGIGGTFENALTLQRRLLQETFPFVPRFLMLRSLKRRCSRKSTTAASAPADSAAGQPLLQLTSTLMQRISRDFPWQSTSAATLTGTR